MKDFDTALAEILAEIPGPLPGEDLSLNSAADQILGRVLSSDVHARRTHPPLAMSAMDGYAVRASDLPGDLWVEREIAAGQHDQRPLAAGEAVRIFTGAPSAARG